MAMPSIRMLSPAELKWFASCAWQSDCGRAKVQERSHAAAMEDTENIRTAIAPAPMRLVVMLVSILREAIVPKQASSVRSFQVCSPVENGHPRFYLFLLFSAQTYS